VFEDPFVHKLQISNELIIMGMLYHQLMLTDNTDKATSKYDVGSSLVVLGIVNYLFPNLYLLLREWERAFREWAEQHGYLKSRKQQVISEYLDVCTKSRQREFILAQERMDKILQLRWESQFKTTSKNTMQIMPLEHVGGHRCNPENWNFYERRSIKNMERRMKAVRNRAIKKAKKLKAKLQG